MARVAFRMRLKPGCEQINMETHDAIWPELAELIRRNGIRSSLVLGRGPALITGKLGLLTVEVLIPALESAWTGRVVSMPETG